MPPDDRSVHIELFDQALQSTLTIVAIILFIISLSLIVLGVKALVESWGAMFGVLMTAEDSFITLITGLGMVVIGIAVLDLTKSILDAELAERKIKNVQERTRDFLTRFLGVIIFAISAEGFILLAQANSIGQGELFGEIAMAGIAVGAMLFGLAYYLKMTAPECRVEIPKRD
jgi:hypothetical protein